LLEYNNVYLEEGPWPAKAQFDAHRLARQRDAGLYLNYGFTRPDVSSQGPIRQMKPGEEYGPAGEGMMPLDGFDAPQAEEVPPPAAMPMGSAKGRPLAAQAPVDAPLAAAPAKGAKRGEFAWDLDLGGDAANAAATDPTWAALTAEPAQTTAATRPIRDPAVHSASYEQRNATIADEPLPSEPHRAATRAAASR
jgi:hypothetical protein